MEERTCSVQQVTSDFKDAIKWTKDLVKVARGSDAFSFRAVGNLIACCMS